MKTIVLATDFSASSENALRYTGQLAGSIKAPVFLLHVYQVPVGMNDVPLLTTSTEELKKHADAGLLREKEWLLKNFDLPGVETESRLGDVTGELKDVCAKIDPLVIVIGKHGASGVEQFLFGSTALSIIRHVTCPVIAVPGNWPHAEMKNAALAIDADVEKVCVQKINELVTNFKTQLHIVHVRREKTAGLQVEGLVNALHSDYSSVFDHEIVHGIASYITENKIDLLIILPHKHNLVERLFVKTHTKELLKKISIPILCICE